MRYAVIEASFDPITQSELDEVLTLRKENKLDYVFLVPTEEGVLLKEERYTLLKRALKPYRKLIASREVFLDELFTIDTADEAKVRTGYFYLAAKGIRKELLRQGYYLENIVDAQCNEHRAAHSKSVAKVCYDIAMANDLDGDKAYMAGMLHDVTKRWSDEESVKVLEIYDPVKLPLNPKIYHSFTAPVWVKQNMGVHDPDILSAMYHHTLGDSSKPLDMILYIADKTDPLRGYDSTKEIELAKKDLSAGFHLVHEESKVYLKEKEGINA